MTQPDLAPAQTDDEILRGIEPMVRKLAHDLMPMTMRRWPERIDDWVQDTLLHLWQKSLPKYEVDSGNKLSTYLYVCARNYILTIIRRELRHKQLRAKGYSEVCGTHPRSIATIGHDTDDYGSDRLGAVEETIGPLRPPHPAVITRVAEAISAHPERILTTHQCRIFHARADNPSLSTRSMAILLGYRTSCGVLKIEQAIRARVRAVDIDEVILEW